MIRSHSVYMPMYKDKEKFILLITGGRGCEDPNTLIIMADLTTKAIKDLRVGDKVMGDDGTPRTVLQTLKGRSEMFRVHQSNAEDYIVNDAHILTMVKSGSAERDGRYTQYSKVTDIPIGEYIGKSKKFKANFFGFKSQSIPYAEKSVAIEPYMLGIWLGDGTAIYPRLTNPDKEIKEYLEGYCQRNGQRLSCNWEKGAWHIGVVSDGKQGSNKFLNALKAYGLIGNKHIPQEYISNSEGVRLELLAGLLDTDGYLSCNTYSISQKSLGMAKQIKYIADTLGFKTSLKVSRKTWNKVDYRDYYTVYICGDVWRIPCKVARKIVRKEDKHPNKNWRYSALSVTPLGVGDWCGMILDGNHRYLHSDGTVTHNSGKSFSVGTFIERLTFELGEADGKRIAHQILYTRYTMVSANISVIPEFLDKVDADGTTKFFRSTKTDVINKKTGSHVMFRGIKTSSGNQTAKLKSIHGITTFVVDEAEEWTSEEEFDTIMFSIRQQGLQNRIIIIMNPTDSNHFVYKRFIKDTHKIVEYDGVPIQISTHPNVLHIHTTYLDNKAHCASNFLAEVEAMKQNNPQKYAHIVMGQWADVAEGAIYKKWGIVDEFPSYAKHVCKGIDWGYTNDETACVKIGVVGNDLYLDEQIYEKGLLTSDIISRLKSEDGDLFVYCDSADPRLIDEVGLGGVIIYPVMKGAGSIVAGITKILDFDNIYVTRRSYNLQEELRNYTWAKDKDGQYINEPIDAYNHACFVADTNIVTDKGEKRIVDIVRGDIVFNSDGWHKVVNTFDNGIDDVADWEIITDYGVVKVTCTPNHKVKTEKGWKHIVDIEKGDVIYVVNSLTERIITSTRGNGTIQKVRKGCILRFGSTITEKCQKGIISTILTETPKTIVSKTLRRLKQVCICVSTQLCDMLKRGNWQRRVNEWRNSKKRQNCGILPKKEGGGIGNMGLKPQSTKSRYCKGVSVAVRNIMQYIRERIGFVPITASLHIEEKKDLTRRKGSVLFVEKRITQKNIGVQKLVAPNAEGYISPMSKGGNIQAVTVGKVKCSNIRKEHIYNFEVDGVHEYIANGLLVSNCDAFRYAVMGKIFGKVMHPRAVNKDDLGIF